MYGLQNRNLLFGWMLISCCCRVNVCPHLCDEHGDNYYGNKDLPCFWLLLASDIDNQQTWSQNITIVKQNSPENDVPHRFVFPVKSIAWCWMRKSVSFQRCLPHSGETNQPWEIYSLRRRHVVLCHPSLNYIWWTTSLDYTSLKYIWWTTSVDYTSLKYIWWITLVDFTSLHLVDTGVSALQWNVRSLLDGFARVENKCGIRSRGAGRNLVEEKRPWCSGAAFSGENSPPMEFEFGICWR